MTIFKIQRMIGQQTAVDNARQAYDELAERRRELDQTMAPLMVVGGELFDAR